MKKLIMQIEDWILSKIQKRCEHPDRMVAADVLEGCADGIAVKYCRRCGAIKTDWNPSKASGRRHRALVAESRPESLERLKETFRSLKETRVIS